MAGATASSRVPLPPGRSSGCQTPHMRLEGQDRGRGGQTNLWTLGPSTGAKLYSLLLHILVPALAS